VLYTFCPGSQATSVDPNQPQIRAANTSQQALSFITLRYQPPSRSLVPVLSPRLTTKEHHDYHRSNHRQRFRRYRPDRRSFLPDVTAEEADTARRGNDRVAPGCDSTQTSLRATLEALNLGSGSRLLSPIRIGHIDRRNRGIDNALRASQHAPVPNERRRPVALWTGARRGRSRVARARSVPLPRVIPERRRDLREPRR
jgi:hypothetical protein